MWRIHFAPISNVFQMLHVTLSLRPPWPNLHIWHLVRNVFIWGCCWPPSDLDDVLPFKKQKEMRLVRNEQSVPRGNSSRNGKEGSSPRESRWLSRKRTQEIAQDKIVLCYLLSLWLWYPLSPFPEFHITWGGPMINSGKGGSSDPCYRSSSFGGLSSSQE